jgi:hypothetical protein
MAKKKVVEVEEPTHFAGYLIYKPGMRLSGGARSVRWRGHLIVVPPLPDHLESYSWVCREVLETASTWANPDPGYFRGQAVIGVHNISPDCDVLSPAPSDRICFECQDGFFLHTTTLKSAKVTLPFTEFQMRVLERLKVAPSQLHLGAWAFIRGFERACFLFGRSEPSYKLFFYLFEVQRTPGLDGKGLVSLKGRKHHVFQPFSDTYKDFKENYFKVAAVEGKVPFWVLPNRSGNKFPLSWSPDHFGTKAKDYSLNSERDLEAEDLTLLRLFEKLVGSFGDKPIKIADILRYGVEDVRDGFVLKLSEFLLSSPINLKRMVMFVYL